VLTYGIDNPKADFNAIDIDSQESGTSFTIVSQGRTVRASLPLPGIFNVENILASSLAVIELLGIPVSELASIFPRLKGVRGRMKDIASGQPFRVIVDYAHTPEAFKKVFSMLRQLVKGKIIAVFGSAGERDVTKRPMQGKVASEYSDIIVLTDEDPRIEDRVKIIEDILAGCNRHILGKNIFIEPDRKQAIRLAFGIAGAGDTVILLGKGHEASIIYPEGPIQWDEIEVARTILSEMGYTDNT
jgi:UDP-N-acetylmuramoyl-L-alanyl-D-glutamate--2,6-diaminopimelate ligase